ncbi:MAG: hypothetical protein II224_03525 [Ruminococcus sp.]|nr:hypothetical protein [Ruminococcus sp.]
MKYPKALTGVRLFVPAEILCVIVSLLTFIIVILVNNIDFTNMQQTDVLINRLAVGYLLVNIFSIIAFVLKLVGFQIARKDERQFRNFSVFVDSSGYQSSVVLFHAAQIVDIKLDTHQRIQYFFTIFFYLGILGKVQDTVRTYNSFISIFFAGRIFPLSDQTQSSGDFFTLIIHIAFFNYLVKKYQFKVITDIL